MHIFFSGIGGAGIGPLALIARQAGYEVSGSDLHDSSYLKYLISQGISDLHVGQSKEKIAQLHAKKPIDWLVYSSALPKTDPNHPELTFCRENNIKATKRDEFLNEILSQKKLKMVAIAGTHGKTTTTAMVIWLFKQLGIPVSYSVGAKISFGSFGEYASGSQYFVYEADEYDRNFLSFHPFMSLISGIDWDHPDIYPSREEYYRAFKGFISQSGYSVIWHVDADELGIQAGKKIMLLHDTDLDAQQINLVGEVNRRNAWLVVKAVYEIVDKPLDELIDVINKFPGLGRRFEEIAPNIYSDYAHTPGKIRGALQMAQEVAHSTRSAEAQGRPEGTRRATSSGQAHENVVVVYEGLHNLRQHFIKDELKNLFDGVKKLYLVPSFLAREDLNLPTLSPQDLKELLSEKSQRHTLTAKLDKKLKLAISEHANLGDIVLCLTAGGTGSLDEWLRKQF